MTAPNTIDGLLRERVQIDASGCWLFTGRPHGSGYAHASLNGVFVLLHRAVYVHLVGPIADGLVLDHLCRVRHCVNPTHLEPVTHAENVRRGSRSNATHCANGHEFTPGNTKAYPARPGKALRRDCRECAKERNRRYRYRIRADREAALRSTA